MSDIENERLDDANAEPLGSDSEVNEGTDEQRMKSDAADFEYRQAFKGALSAFMARVVIFRHDLEPSADGDTAHSREPIEWELYEDLMKVGIVEQCSSKICGNGLICCVVFKDPKSVTAARELGGCSKHQQCGAFIEPGIEHTALIRYSQVVSEALASHPQTLKLHTECLMVPVYEPRYCGTTGFLAPVAKVLGAVAVPVPGDVIANLFQFRTFICVPGHQEGSMRLENGENRRNQFLPTGDEWDQDYSHLRRPSMYWPFKVPPTKGERSQMRSSIQNSLIEGNATTVLIPSVESLAARQEPKREVPGPVSPTGSLVVATKPNLPRNGLTDTAQVNIIAHQAVGAKTREFYITFRDAASAVKVYDEPSHAEGRHQTLDLLRCLPLPSAYGDWLARFCYAETARPIGCCYLTCIHPSTANVTLHLLEASCTPVIDPIPQATIPTPIRPQDQGASYIPQSSKTKAQSDEERYVISLVKLIRESLLPSELSSPISPKDMVELSHHLSSIELASSKYPTIPQDAEIVAILQAVSLLPEALFPNEDIYNFRKRCRYLVAPSADAKFSPLTTMPLKGATAAQQPQIVLEYAGGQIVGTNNSWNPPSSDQQKSMKREREDNADPSDSRDDVDAKRPRY